MKKFYWKDYLMALPIIILFLVTTKFSVINAESYNSINNKVDFLSDVITKLLPIGFMMVIRLIIHQVRFLILQILGSIMEEIGEE